MPDHWRSDTQKGYSRIKDHDVDFTIVCGDKQRKVHSLILCIYSPVLQKLCQGDFKEAHERKADLSEDNFDTLSAMIDYFYTSTWDYPNNLSHMEFDCMLCILADKYLVEGLKEAAIDRFKETCSLDKVQNDKELAKIASVAYSAPGATKGLRPALSEMIVRCKAWDTSQYQSTLATSSDFAIDLLEAQKKYVNLQEKVRVRCDYPGCGRTVDVYVTGDATSQTLRPVEQWLTCSNKSCPNHGKKARVRELTG